MPAHLLTWTTYATWLPGDRRGHVSRVPATHGYEIHNAPGIPYDADDPALRARAQSRMEYPRTVLDQPAARVCRDAFLATAERHTTRLLAGAIMPTHIHLVLASDDTGKRLLQLFKGNASRELNRDPARARDRWWTKSGSRRVLTTPPSIEGAIRYVLEQDAPLEVFRERTGGRAG